MRFFRIAGRYINAALIEQVWIMPDGVRVEVQLQGGMKVIASKDKVPGLNSEVTEAEMVLGLVRDNLISFGQIRYPHERVKKEMAEARSEKTNDRSREQSSEKGS
jgi:hypothetical protein